MVAAGWTVCGNAPSSYYSVTGGYLTLQNDGSVVAWMCRSLTATGADDWMVSDRAAAVGGGYASFQLNALTVGHQWTLQADGYYSTLVLARDQIHVLEVPGYFPTFGVYHVVSMEMKNGVISIFLDGRLFGSFTAGRTGSAVTGVAMGASWTATDSYDYVTAASL